MSKSAENQQNTETKKTIHTSEDAYFWLRRDIELVLLKHIKQISQEIIDLVAQQDKGQKLA